MENEGLRLGMFLAGLLMASVPVSLAIGIAIYALRRHRREGGPAEGGSPDAGAPNEGGRADRAPGRAWPK